MRIPQKFLSVLAGFACLGFLFVAAVPAQGGGSVPYLRTMDEVHSVARSSPVPILIQFDATWCGYCKALGPHMQKLYDTTSPARLKVFKVDMDISREVAAEFGVSSVPVLFIIHKGKTISSRRGGMSEAELFSWVRGVQKEAGQGNY